MSLLKKGQFSVIFWPKTAIFENWPEGYPKMVQIPKNFVAHHNFTQ